MFRDLQKGYTVSVLDKSGGKLAFYNGTVVGRGEPRFDGKGFGQGGGSGVGGGLGMPISTERVIDLTVEANGKTQTYVVPENGNVASATEITVSCDTSFITNEVQSMLKKSEDVLASVETHKRNIEECRDILARINPRIGESQEQNRRLDAMEGKIDGMSKLIERIAASLQSQPKQKEK